MNAKKTERFLISAVALHSCGMGIAMLFMPVQTLKMIGWNYEGPLFFPSQSGIFLLILGGAYITGIWYKPFAWFLVASKFFAVLFLSTSIILDTAPDVILFPSILDGAMGLLVATVLICNRPSEEMGKG